MLAKAETIYLVGQRRSFCVSHYLAYALAQLGVRAILVDNVGGIGPDQMARADEKDALIAVSFSPYSPVTIALARQRAQKQTPIVVITDSALSPLAGIADARFEIVESDFGAFRSLAATFCLAMTLAVAVAERREARAPGLTRHTAEGSARIASSPSFTCARNADKIVGDEIDGPASASSRSCGWR